MTGDRCRAPQDATAERGQSSAAVFMQLEDEVPDKIAVPTTGAPTQAGSRSFGELCLSVSPSGQNILAAAVMRRCEVCKCAWPQSSFDAQSWDLPATQRRCRLCAHRLRVAVNEGMSEDEAKKSFCGWIFQQKACPWILFPPAEHWRLVGHEDAWEWDGMEPHVRERGRLRRDAVREQFQQYHDKPTPGQSAWSWYNESCASDMQRGGR
jgi:hypothetical protein